MLELLKLDSSLLLLIVIIEQLGRKGKMDVLHEKTRSFEMIIFKVICNNSKHNGRWLFWEGADFIV